jgi:hypothetical protein
MQSWRDYQAETKRRMGLGRGLPLFILPEIFNRRVVIRDAGSNSPGQYA